jgi:hypothetical protein
MLFSRRLIYFASGFIFVMMGLIFLKSSFEVEAISDIENLQAQIDELAKLKTLSENATTPLEKKWQI